MNPNLQKARLALEGLSIGDAFGQNFFHFKDAKAAQEQIDHRVLPVGEWHYTDDTNMALSIYALLRDKGAIDQDVLALSFAQHYHPSRGYGAGAGKLLRDIAGGADWRQAAGDMFEGQGSFGNGAAMRVALIGGFFADDMDKVIEQARLSGEVTHTHLEGIAGAIAIAVAAALASRLHGGPAPTRAEFIERVLPYIPDSEVKSGVRRAMELRSTEVAHAVGVLGNGILISAQDTVPFCLWCVGESLANFEEAMWRTVAGFGDIDTNCAIVGGIVGLFVGEAGLPQEWLTQREKLPNWAM
jgi:ADP-ribosylglycohydrolase